VEALIEAQEQVFVGDMLQLKVGLVTGAEARGEHE